MRQFLLPLSIGFLGMTVEAMASSYTLPYAGRLLTQTGRPLRGPISMTVNFYGSGTGGSILGAQVFPTVTLQDGLFNLTIELSAASFESVFSASEVWIEVIDNSNGKTYPRQKFGAVPFAFKVPTDGLTLGYDANGKLRVQGLGPAALPAGNPSDGQILKWKDGTGWEWGADESGGSSSAVDSTAIVDGTISNADIAANAAIAGSKIAPNFGAQNIATTGTITGDGSGLTNLPAGPLGTSIDGSEIAAGSITDSHIAAGAAIDASKINGLSAALAAREGTITAGTAAQYFKGDKTWATLDTSAVPENVNLYYTDTRARSALSASAPLSYNSTTGAFTISSASGVSAGTISAAEYLSFSAKQAAITASSTINTGSLTTAQQMAVEINPYGTNAGESSELRFKELAAAGTNYVGFKAPDSLAANQIYVLPPADGSGGQFLSTDGAGNLSWGSVVGGSGGTVTSITAGTGLTGGSITGSGTINLANTAVSAGAYTRANITVDAQGRLTAAANGGSVDLTSDITGILPLANGGTGATTAALARTALNAASSGANSDISSITGLTTALSLAQGGTGATTAPLARTALSAAASGANSDITSITGLTTALNLAQGGTGATTAGDARAALSAASSGTNSDITSITGLTTALSLAQGGTGATTAPLARAALSAAASGANSDITSLTGLTTALSIAQGGTGATTAGDSRSALGLGGLATLNSVTTSQITDATIVDADVSASAAIAQSKIADLTSDLSTLSSGVAGKEAAITAGTTAQYWRGDKSWQTLDSSIVAENSNLYFTDARSRGAVSATAPLSYNNGTGVFSIPSATSVANGYLSSGDWLAFNNKQAAISAASSVNTGTLTTAQQNGLSLNPFGTNAGETGEIHFNELAANGSEYIGFKAPSAITTTRIWTLPAADGTTGQVLSTNGTGTLTWISPGGGGTVTSITAGTGLSGGAITGSGTIDLADTTVSAGSYTRANITVDAQGRLTAAANGSSVNLTSDITGTLPLANGGTGATTAALARGALSAASSGANSDITSITGLTTALSLGQGGTGATTAALARTALSAAASGTNSDITSITGLTTALSLGQGGTGATTAALARTALSAAASGTNSDITSITGLTTALSLGQGGTGATTAPLARAALSAATSGANSDITSITGLTTALSLAQGGTGATTAPLARTALSAAASGANSDITSITGLTTALSLAQGGTGATTAADARTALGLGGLAALSSVTTTQITDATIVDADISASAAIAQSKIADLTSDLSTLSSGIAGKEAAISAGTTSQYWRGDKSWQTLDTNNVPENTNLYFTDARARATVSGTAPLSYNSTSGVFSMAAATSVANGYLSSGDWLTFNNKQAAISAASTVNTGTMTTALQNGLSLNPFGTNAGETGEIRFNELVANGSEYIGFKAPNAITTTRIWTLPGADGSNGQVLSTNGTGTLTWISPGGGGTVTSITAGTGLSGGAITGSGTIDLANTTVSAGSYTRANITVDAQGRLTAAANGSSVNLTSDITGTLPIANGGTGATTAALARGALSAASSGANSDITSITGLTTALSLGQGGTGATTAPLARAALSAAASGANSDITSITGLTTALSLGQGGTGATTAALARTALSAAASGANSDITSITGLTTALSLGQGGTGATTAALARTALSAAGSGTNSDITSITGLTTALSLGQGGTGATTAALARTALGAASSGANSNITSLTGLTTALSLSQGGTGATTAPLARTALSAAASGTNSDITSITGLTTALSLAQGGTGATTAPLARTALNAASSGANSDITSITGLTTALSLAQGGTGATTAALARAAVGAAASGANSDITSITGLTTALSLAQGGTGATTAPLARAAVGAAASGANSDITSLTGLTTSLSLAQGGTGATTAALARTSLSAASSGANSDITSLSGLTTALSIAQGGTGGTTAAAARSAMSAAASGANSDITSLTGLTTALSIAQGGTGGTTQAAARTALGLGSLATLSAVGSSEITDASVADIDISASAAIDTSKIADGTVSSTEFQYINSLTSNAQTQLNAKASASNPTFTGQILSPLGTVGAPTYSFTGDPNTGVYSSAADTLDLGTAGVTRLRVLPAGQVQISKEDSWTNKPALRISKPGAPTSITYEDSYLHLGGYEYATNGKQAITFGYQGGGAVNPAAYIGYNEENSGGSEYGPLLFGTRSVTTDTAASERMRITPAGRIGIGSTNPEAFVTAEGDFSANNSIGMLIKGSSATSGAVLSLLNTTVGAWGIGIPPSTNRLSFFANRYPGQAGTEVVSMLHSGNVGLGTTNPTQKLHVSSDGIASILLENSNAGSEKTQIAFKNSSVTQAWSIGSDYLGNNGDNLFVWGGGSGDVRMFINSSGNVGIGTTAPVVPLEVATSVDHNVPGSFGRLNASGASTDSNKTVATSILAGGRITASTFAATSDRRMKEDIIEISEETANKFIYDSRPVHFRWKTGSKSQSYGFIAQEIDSLGLREMIALTPNKDMVGGIEEDGYVNPDGFRLNLDYDQIIPLITKAVQVMRETLDDLITKVTGMDHKIEELKRVNDDLKRENEQIKNFLCNKYDDAEICK